MKMLAPAPVLVAKVTSLKRTPLAAIPKLAIALSNTTTPLLCAKVPPVNVKSPWKVVVADDAVKVPPESRNCLKVGRLLPSVRDPPVQVTLSALPAVNPYDWRVSVPEG